MSDLYDTDILQWSELQADALRRRAANELDWDNVAEEIESVGNEQLHAVESLLVQALRYDLKAHCWPLHRNAPSWRADAVDFRLQAQRRFTASMRQKLDMARIHRHAIRGLPETLDGQAPLPVPTELPALDELLSDEP